MTIRTDFSLPLDVPQTFGMLGMTANRDIAEYVDYLGMKNIVELICWVAGINPDDLNSIGKLNDFTFVDIGTASGIALLDIYDYLKYHLGSYFLDSNSRLIGTDKYNFSERYHSNSHKKNPRTGEQLPGPYKKIQANNQVELRYGDFTNLPLMLGEATKLVSIYAFLCYGSTSSGEDYGAAEQINQLFLKSSANMEALITVTPNIYVIDKSRKIPLDDDGTYTLEYNDEDLFKIMDPVTYETTNIQLLKLLKQRGFQFEIFQPPVLKYGAMPLPILKIRKNSSEA